MSLLDRPACVHPKAAAGSSICSRDMNKWGMLILNEGKWNGEQLIPAAFIRQATSRLHTNNSGTSYGFFWWRHDMEYAGKKYDCISGRGAGGQFIFVLPALNLSQLAAVVPLDCVIGKTPWPAAYDGRCKTS